MAFDRPRLLPAAVALAALGWATLSLPARQASSEPPPVVAAHDPLANRPPAGPTPAASDPRRLVARLVTKAPWGSSPGSLGHEIPAEGNPQGPMSFAVDAAGRIHALDTVNARVTILESGRPGRAVPLPSDTIDDLELLPDGYLALDRHIARSIHVLNGKGQERGRIDLSGPGVPHTGLVTALFTRGDEVWAEVEHTRLVHVADTHGQPTSHRAAVPGRFTADGRGLLSAARVLPSSIRVVTRTPSLQERELAAPTFPLPVARITALESTPDGGVMVGVILHRDRTEAPYDTLEARHLLLGLGADGSERWRAELPVDEGPEEKLREVRLGGDGALYGMVFRKDGVEFWQVKP